VLCYQISSKDKRLILISLGILGFSLAIWDQRLEYEHLISASIGKNHLSARTIPPNAQVLWPECPEASWFLLNRTNYVSRLQASGIVFSRETALLLDKRIKNIGSLKDLENPVRFYLSKDAQHSRKFYLATIKQGCNLAPDLDFIILPYEVTQYKPTQIISLHDIRTRQAFVPFHYEKYYWYLYNCKSVKSCN
jgi:hypothetical protein